jgi:hypothetical protein
MSVVSLWGDPGDHVPSFLFFFENRPTVKDAVDRYRSYFCPKGIEVDVDFTFGSKQLSLSHPIEANREKLIYSVNPSVLVGFDFSGQSLEPISFSLLLPRGWTLHIVLSYFGKHVFGRPVNCITATERVIGAKYDCVISPPPVGHSVRKFRLFLPGGSFLYQLCISDSALIQDVRVQIGKMLGIGGHFLLISLMGGSPLSASNTIPVGAAFVISILDSLAFLMANQSEPVFTVRFEDYTPDPATLERLIESRVGRFDSLILSFSGVAVDPNSDLRLLGSCPAHPIVVTAMRSFQFEVEGLQRFFGWPIQTRVCEAVRNLRSTLNRPVERITRVHPRLFIGNKETDLAMSDFLPMIPAGDFFRAVIGKTWVCRIRLPDGSAWQMDLGSLGQEPTVAGLRGLIAPSLSFLDWDLVSGDGGTIPVLAEKDSLLPILINTALNNTRAHVTVAPRSVVFTFWVGRHPFKLVLPFGFTVADFQRESVHRFKLDDLPIEIYRCRRGISDPPSRADGPLAPDARLFGSVTIDDFELQVRGSVYQVIALSQPSPSDPPLHFNFPFTATVTDFCTRINAPLSVFEQRGRRVLADPSALLSQCPLELCPVSRALPPSIGPPPAVVPDGLFSVGPDSAARHSWHPPQAEGAALSGLLHPANADPTYPPPSVFHSAAGARSSPHRFDPPVSTQYRWNSNAPFCPSPSAFSPFCDRLPPAGALPAHAPSPESPISKPPPPPPTVVLTAPPAVSQRPPPPAPPIAVTLILPPDDKMELATLPATATARDALIAAYGLDARLDPALYFIHTGDKDCPLDGEAVLASLDEPRDLWVCPLPTDSAAAATPASAPPIAADNPCAPPAAEFSLAPESLPLLASADGAARRSPPLPSSAPESARPSFSVIRESFAHPTMIPAPVPARFAGPVPSPPSLSIPIDYSSRLRTLHARTGADLRACRRCLNHHRYDLEAATASLSNRP